MLHDILIHAAFLVFMVAIGWIAGRVFRIDAKGLSDLLLSIVSPFVVCHAIVESSADSSFFRYTGAAFAFSCGLALCAYVIGRCLWNSGKANLFSFAAGDSNTGYFALPIAFSLFDTEQIAIAMFIILGVNLYEFSFGYFILAQGTMSARQGLKQVARLPALYAALAAIILKKCDLTLDESLSSCLKNFRGTYSVLGMMVVGMTLSELKKIHFDWLFNGLSLLWNHVVQPALGYVLFGLWLGVQDATMAVVLLMLAAPMASNSVIIACTLDVYPEVVAPAVMMSIVLALVSVVLFLSLVIPLH